MHGELNERISKQLRHMKVEGYCAGRPAGFTTAGYRETTGISFVLYTCFTSVSLLYTERLANATAT